jgi:hypothetical protein
VSFTDGSVLFATVAATGGSAHTTAVFSTAGSHLITATYSGDASNGTSSGTTTVTAVAVQVVTPPPPPPPAPMKKPKVQLKGSTTSASVGDKIKLTWSTKHATLVKAGGDWSGSMKSKGSTWVRITAPGKHVFTLTASNTSGAKTAKVKVKAVRKAKTFELTPVTLPLLVGSELPVVVDGLAAGESFTIRLGTVVLATGTADQHGKVELTVVIPKTTKEGLTALTLTGSEPDRVGTVPISVIVATKTLKLTLASHKVAINGTTVLTVTGLAPDEPVTISSDGAKLTTGAADAKGTFKYTVNVGPDTGKQHLTAVGAAPGRIGQTKLKVVQPGQDNGGGGGGTPPPIETGRPVATRAPGFRPAR